MAEHPSRRALGALRKRREKHVERSRAYRAGFATVGFVIVALGLLLIPLPGPGLVVLAVGLAMLALEFRWAERMLERCVDRIERATSGRLGKVLTGAAVVGAVGAVAAAGLWDIPLLPV